MEATFMRDKATGTTVPASFQRVPMVKEILIVNQQWFEVQRVLHSWNAQRQPVAMVEVIPYTGQMDAVFPTP